jgi:hypothetical protein
MFGLTWKRIVDANAENRESAKGEYRVYRQLCWMKHSLPKMQDMRVVTDQSFELVFGPHTDERAINHAWFSLEHAGRLTEITISLVANKLGNDEIRTELDALTERRSDLSRRASERFGATNPFEIDNQKE